MFGQAGVDHGGAAGSGVLLLDEALGEAHEGGVFIGAVAVDDLAGVVLGVVEVGAAAEVAEFAANGVGVASERGLAGVEADEGLLECEVVELDAGVFVEGGVVLGEAVGGLEGAAGGAGVAGFQGGVAEGEHLLGGAGFFVLTGGFVLEVVVEVHGGGDDGVRAGLEFEGAGGGQDLPVVIHVDVPGDVFEGKIEFGGEEGEVEVFLTAGADVAAVVEFDGDGFAAMGGLFEGEEPLVGLEPGPDAVFIDEGEPEAGAGGEGEVEEAFVAGFHLEADLGEHDAGIGDDGGEGDVLDAGGEEVGGLVALNLQRKLEVGVDEAVGEVGGDGREVGLQSARDALPFGGLEGFGGGVDVDLEAAGGLDGDEAALEVDLSGADAAEDGPGGLVGDEGLVGDLKKVLADDAALELDVPGLKVVGDGAGDGFVGGELVALEGDAEGGVGKFDAEVFEAGVFNLVGEVGLDLDLGFGDGGLLEAGDLDPRVDLLDVEGEAPGGLEDLEGEDAFLADAGLLGVELGDAVAVGGLEAEALLGDDEEGAALFAGFAEDELGDGPGGGGFDAGAGKGDVKGLFAKGLAGEVEGDDAAVGGF